MFFGLISYHAEIDLRVTKYLGKASDATGIFSRSKNEKVVKEGGIFSAGILHEEGVSKIGDPK